MVCALIVIQDIIKLTINVSNVKPEEQISAKNVLSDNLI